MKTINILTVCPLILAPPSRWENTQSLGASRRNFGGSVILADFLWFWLRQSGNDSWEVTFPDVDLIRIQKTLDTYVEL